MRFARGLHALAGLAAAALLLGGCARDEEIKTAEELYQEAVELEESGDDVGAAEKYAELQAAHPFGTYAQQAQLNLAHMYFNLDDYDKTLAAADRFLTDYPNHANTDYVLYMRSMALLRASPSIVSRMLGEETYRRSQGSLVAAHESFTELVERFPATRYSSEAAFRIRFIVNEIARIELEAARYYMRRGAYGAAARRAAHLLASYPDSTSGEEALALMAASLHEMGADQAADDALDSLRSSFPGSALLEPASVGAEELAQVLGITKPGDVFTRALER